MSRSRSTCTSSACTCCRPWTTSQSNRTRENLLAPIPSRDSLEFPAQLIRFQSHSATPGENKLSTGSLHDRRDNGPGLDPRDAVQGPQRAACKPSLVSDALRTPGSSVRDQLTRGRGDRLGPPC